MIRFILPDLRRIETSGTAGLVLYRFDDRVPFTGVASLVDWRLHGHLSQVTIDGFFEGKTDQPLLMPLGQYLPQQFLMVLGLGEKALFDREVFKERVAATFEIAKGLNVFDLTLALPGRVEGICDEESAIEWFIDVYDRSTDITDIVIIEPAAAQKEMLPAVERWRLRSLVPGA